MNRIYNLDYLRGLAAFGIMIYHYLSWTYGHFSTDSIIDRTGVYGVAIFYVLSGLTLFHVYHKKMLPSKRDLADFFRKRAFRILPLFWLVTISPIVKSGKVPDLTYLGLNLTGLFGFFAWDKYLATGAWSIGNELVFYVFFPFFVLFYNKAKVVLALLSVLIFGIYLYFSFFRLDDSINLAVQWKDYINPLNQLFLFLSGFLIGACFKDVKMSLALSFLLLITGLCIFSYYPVSGDPVNLVTGFTRLAFTLSCILICTSFYKFSFELPKAIHIPFKTLGEMSYSVYLMHPLVYALMKVLNKKIFNFSPEVLLGLCISATFLLSYFIYKYFEKYFMKLGSRTQSPQLAEHSTIPSLRLIPQTKTAFPAQHESET